MTGDRDLIILLGLPRSGSTWAFNVVREILKASAHYASSFYAETMADCPPDAFLATGPIVIKTHFCDLGEDLIKRGKLIVSLRDPRDAVASEMTMFGMSFEDCLGVISKSADGIMRRLPYGPLILQYENGDIGSSETVSSIATHIGYPINEDTSARITHMLSRESVQQLIADLQSTGEVSPDECASMYHPETHWHPGHVKDGQVGKYATILTDKEAARVASNNLLYMARFYKEQITPRVSLPAMIEFGDAKAGNGYLKHGFSSIEPEGVWTCESRAVIQIPLEQPLRRSLSIRLLFTPACAVLPGTETTVRLVVNRKPFPKRVYALADKDAMVDLCIRDSSISKWTSIIIELDFDDIKSPSEMGYSDDHRKLGALIKYVALESDPGAS